MHTVPAGMAMSMAGAAATEKRSTPPDRTAFSRSNPRMVPCRSRKVPWAVWGKLWSSTQSACISSAWSSAAAAHSRTARSQPASGVKPTRARKSASSPS